MTPSPFQIGQAIGSNIGQVQERHTDLTAIDQILSQAGQSGDQQVIDTAMNQILSRVSPQRQKTALDILNKRRERALEQQRKQQERESFKRAGLDPELAELPADVRREKIKSAEAQKRFEQITGTQERPVVDREIDAAAETQGLRGLSEDQLIQLSGVSEYSMPAREELKRRQEEVKAARTAFEPESEKLEAKRVAELATEIENDFKSAQSENIRLGRMEKLDEKGTLSTPAMVKTLNTLGLPIGILSNPDSEEFVKLEADYLRDIRQVFQGRVTNYEVQAFLKGIPSLMNTPEGKRAIIRNRRLINDAKQLRYDAYKDILKENQGRKPPNMGIMIEERIQEGMSDIEEKFREGVNEQNDKFQQPIRMIDPQGRIVNIPPNQIEAAMNAGAKFQ